MLVLGTRSPEVPDLERIQRLHHLAPGVPVVIVTTDSEAHGVFLAVSAGVCGYLVTPVRPATLARALADAARGLPTLCQKVQRTLLTGIQAAGAGVPAPLTAREQQILDLLFQNLRDKEIAEILRIAPGTVHVHLANLFLKLGVRRPQGRGSKVHWDLTISRPAASDVKRRVQLDCQYTFLVVDARPRGDLRWNLERHLGQI